MTRRTICRTGLMWTGVLVLVLSACGGSTKGSSTTDASGTAGTGSAEATGGGGTSGADGGAADNTPVGLCKRLVATLCTRAKDCHANDGGVTDVATCETEQDVAFGCDRATSTDFSGCLNDVTALSCNGLFSSTSGLVLPGSCDAPLNIPLSDAQKNCGVIIEIACDPTDVCANTIPTTTSFTDCANQGFDDSGCYYAESTGATFNQCLTDLCASSTADGGQTLPGSCNTAINFVQ